MRYLSGKKYNSFNDRRTSNAYRFIQKVNLMTKGSDSELDIDLRDPEIVLNKLWNSVVAF